MDVKDLSSNWKKLQAVIAPDKLSSSSQVDSNGNRINHRRSAKRKFGAKEPEDEVQASQSSRPVTSASLALWAEDNDLALKDVTRAYGQKPTDPAATTVTEYVDRPNEGLSNTVEIGTYVALDCEMVGVGINDKSALARVSVVNFHGEQIYDSYVQPGEKVTNWRTWVSGIEKKHMINARAKAEVQEEVGRLLKGKILIGHSLKNDFKALELSHAPRMVRDTSKLEHFRNVSGGRSPSLKKLCSELLGLDIQNAEHSSIEDARACMLLFRCFKAQFEVEHSQRHQKLAEAKAKNPNSRKTRTKKALNEKRRGQQGVST